MAAPLHVERAIILVRCLNVRIASFWGLIGTGGTVMWERELWFGSLIFYKIDYSVLD